MQKAALQKGFDSCVNNTFNMEYNYLWILS